jgi:transposase InsO family protein
MSGWPRRGGWREGAGCGTGDGPRSRSRCRGPRCRVGEGVAVAKRVAADLRSHGWRLERVLTYNGSEFGSQVFGDAVRALGATQTFIGRGRPQTNGAVERVQRRSSTSAGDRPSRGASCPSSVASSGTSRRTSRSTMAGAHIGRPTRGLTP